MEIKRINCLAQGNWLEEELKNLLGENDFTFLFEHRDSEEITIRSTEKSLTVTGNNDGNILSGLYCFLEELGFLFDFSKTYYPSQKVKEFPRMTKTVLPKMRERGIRMHLNFVQDQSCFSQEEFEKFVDNMPRMKFNFLLFHMYNCQEWYPFSFRGIQHLDLSVGNLNRKHLREDMIGRDKILVSDHWFPREFEKITDPQELMMAMYSRYKDMMRRAKERGQTVAVSFEPEVLSEKFSQHLKKWSREAVLQEDSSKVNDWQQNWSGQKLAEMDVRNPVVLEIAKARCEAIVRSFPDLDQIHFISREGTAFRCENDGQYLAELERISKKFGFDLSELDIENMRIPYRNTGNLNHTANQYWTIQDGENHFPTVTATLRYLEMCLEILKDEKIAALLQERHIEPVITVYQPNPDTVRYIAPAVAKMCKNVAFHLLADYGAKDIAEHMDNWKPFCRENRRTGCISWLEFDGSMMLLQGWTDSIRQNAEKAQSLGISTMYFNHWRVRGNEHNARAASDACFAGDPPEKYLQALFGEQACAQAEKAFRLLEEATIFSKKTCFNVGFTCDWVVNICTNPPGYYWKDLKKSEELYLACREAFDKLSRECAERGKEQAMYLADMCYISAKHLEGVLKLQCAKLPLYGFHAWPLDSKQAMPPPKDLAQVLSDYAQSGLECEYEFMRIQAKWTKTCDQQRQLAMHQQGLIEPFEQLAAKLREYADQ